MDSRRIGQLFVLLVFALSLCCSVDQVSFFACAENENSQSDVPGVARVVQDQHTGECAITNSCGEFIVPYTPDDLQLFQIGPAVFCIQRVDDEGNQSYALCNAYRTLTDFDFTYIQTSYAGDYPILVTNTDDQDGYIDACGQWIIPPVFFYAEPFSEGVALVQTEEKLGYIDPYGTFVLQYTYDDLFAAESFSEGLAAVGYNKSGLWSYIDVQGERIINDYFAEAYSFSCGFARVWNAGEYYFIDHRGNILCDTRFSYASDFVYGYAIVANASKQYGIVDASGILVYPTTANNILNITDDHFCWICPADSALWGLYNLQTESFVCPDMYELPFEEGFIGNEEGFIVKKNDLYGYLSKEGTLLLPCQYEFLGMDADGTLLKYLGDNHR